MSFLYMKYFLLLFLSLLLFCCNEPHTQKISEPSVSGKEWLDTLDTQNELGLFTQEYEYKEYEDKEGKHLLIFSRHMYTNLEGEPYQDSLKAVNISVAQAGQVVEWEMKDFIRLEKTDELQPEYHVSFLMDYVSLEDLDNDGLVDPILVYGTLGINGVDDGRVKILLYYKGEKIGIRHQSGVLDFERNTQVDTSFYSLPETLKSHIMGLMDKIVEAEQVIFPAGWKDAMQEGKTYFDENE